MEQDRYFAPDIAAAKRLLLTGAIGDLAGEPLFDEAVV